MSSSDWSAGADWHCQYGQKSTFVRFTPLATLALAMIASASCSGESAGALTVGFNKATMRREIVRYAALIAMPVKSGREVAETCP